MFLLVLAALISLAAAENVMMVKIPPKYAHAKSYISSYGKAEDQKKALLDGNKETRLHTECKGSKQWIGVKFDKKCFIQKIKFVNGKHNSHKDRINKAQVVVVNGNKGVECGEVKVKKGNSFDEQTYEMTCPKALYGDEIRMINGKSTCTELSEFEAFGYCDCPAGQYLENEKCEFCPAGEYSSEGSTSKYDCSPFWKGWIFPSQVGPFTTNSLNDCAISCSKLAECLAINFDEDLKKCSFVTKNENRVAQQGKNVKSATIEGIKGNLKLKSMLEGSCQTKNGTKDETKNETS